MEMTTKELGTRGERVAQIYLERQGYTLLACNYTNRLGEIDIIAKKEETIAFVEVKTRRSTVFGTPIEAVHQRKQQKIRKVAAIYLEDHAEEATDVRFDVFAIWVHSDLTYHFSYQLACF